MPGNSLCHGWRPDGPDAKTLKSGLQTPGPLANSSGLYGGPRSYGDARTARSDGPSLVVGTLANAEGCALAVLAGRSSVGSCFHLLQGLAGIEPPLLGIGEPRTDL